MTTITVTKDGTGKLCGFSEKDKRAYARFRKLIEKLESGELFTLDYWFPRNPKLHRKHFAMLAVIFDAQERFEDSEQMRMWLQIGAGHCVYVPGQDGEICAIPKSIAWSKMDDAEFEAHHQAVKDFLRTEHARAFLWPHLSVWNSIDMAETILAEFDS